MEIESEQFTNERKRKIQFPCLTVIFRLFFISINIFFCCTFRFSLFSFCHFICSMWFGTRWFCFTLKHSLRSRRRRGRMRKKNDNELTQKRKKKWSSKITKYDLLNWIKPKHVWLWLWLFFFIRSYSSWFC